MANKPYLSAYYLINVALLDRPPDQVRHWLDEGNAIDPNNARLRLRYMDTLVPAWRGSLQQMRQFR
jgi:hypothetical protein